MISVAYFNRYYRYWVTNEEANIFQDMHEIISKYVYLQMFMFPAMKRPRIRRRCAAAPIKAPMYGVAELRRALSCDNAMFFIHKSAYAAYLTGAKLASQKVSLSHKGAFGGSAAQHLRIRSRFIAWHMNISE